MHNTSANRRWRPKSCTLISMRAGPFGLFPKSPISRRAFRFRESDQTPREPRCPAASFTRPPGTGFCAHCAFRAPSQRRSFDGSSRVIPIKDPPQAFPSAPAEPRRQPLRASAAAASRALREDTEERQPFPTCMQTAKQAPQPAPGVTRRHVRGAAAAANHCRPGPYGPDHAIGKSASIRARWASDVTGKRVT
ncbi:hypothetical protein CLV78_102185 [Aliiruegeria haliotis]|uniref:Uncharacterized protein n=1 Tax=Aliiruegeria haliotis TaxID=1280846 RepID=A0A2T0RV43_9RHOB|nr:hypothetical protein CLV78_102185 [Aliiruegeria haliotis]